MAKALVAIDAAKLNIRLHHGDAADLLSWLKPDFGRAGRSDLPRSMAEAPALETPFRAARKRRLDRRHSSRAGGEFRFVSDIADYAGWTLGRVTRSPCLHGPPSAPTIGASPGPDLTERVMRRKPSARAARHVI